MIRKYATYYLPRKPMLLDRLPKMGGTAWGCWCAPQPCHADILLQKAEEAQASVQRPLERM